MAPAEASADDVARFPRRDGGGEPDRCSDDNLDTRTPVDRKARDATSVGPTGPSQQEPPGWVLPAGPAPTRGTPGVSKGGGRAGRCTQGAIPTGSTYRATNGAPTPYEQPLVAPQRSHFSQVPLRTRVKEPQSGQASPV